MFSKILIANRGEIACRIARTARRMGIKTVAVYSAADCNVRHVTVCDEAFAIGDAPAAESYLCGQKIIDAAIQSGAEAVHPGYGFLSENADFADACARAKLIFIGAPPSAIRAMGIKDVAKKIMRDAGVPVVPAVDEKAKSSKQLQAAAKKLGYPLLIKAVAGGGGKGMRVVKNAAAFAEALATVKREARAAFADDRVMVEKYLPDTRHVEVQIFADQHGHIMHLFERDCSAQRRHQKILEEAPAAGVDAQLRKRMTVAAMDAARAINYVGAGTVEFLLGGDAFYFMEMNTRLQVEHPVTEMIAGVDLVEWQLLVAAGESLPQQSLTVNGCAMEARIYAENAQNNFLPATGTLTIYRPPPTNKKLRLDSGVAQGDDITPHYDPMMAKLIAWGDTREAARNNLRDALAAFDIIGVENNLAFLYQLTGADDFIQARVTTAWVENNYDRLIGDDGDELEISLIIATLFQNLPAAGDGDEHWSPWSRSLNGAWQINLPTDVTVAYTVTGNRQECTVRFDNGHTFAQVAGKTTAVKLTPLPNGRFEFICGDKKHTVSVDDTVTGIHINFAGHRHVLATVTADDAEPDTGDTVNSSGEILSPMPGVVLAVLVVEREIVKRGAPLVTVEAMKMEHTVRAPVDGTVTRVNCKRGAQVGDGAHLITLTSQQ